MKKQSDIFSELMVGIFVLAVLVVLIFFTVIVSGAEIFTGHKRVTRHALFSDIGGLRKNDNVILRGMTVGSVTGMKLEENNVRVAMTIDTNVQLKEGYRITVKPTTLLGGHFLLVEEGDGAPVAEDAVLQGAPPSDLLRDIGEAVNEIRSTLSNNGVSGMLANFNSASASVSNLLMRVENGEGTLGKLFAKDSQVYDDIQTSVANLKSATAKLEKGESTLGKLLSDDAGPYEDLKQTVASLKTVAQRIENGEGSIGRLLKDDGQVYEDFSATIANIKDVTARIQKGEGTLGKLMSEDAAFYTSLSEAAESLKTVLARLEKGEGSLGKLSKDDDLYKEVLGTIKDSRQVIDNLRDTAPITTFSTILFGAL